MESKTCGQLKRLSRLLALVSVGLLVLLLTWLVVVASSQASAQILANGVPLSLPRMSSLPTINIEFFYSGGDPAGASTAADDFADLLSQETGLDIQAEIQSCEAGIVEHLGSGSVDLAPLSGVAYVLGHDAYGIEAKLVNGMSGAYAYRSQINVAAASGYTDIWDLQGTQFASPSPGSASGYMLPYLLVSETTGITPTAFFSEIDFVGSHSQVIREVYTGMADCGATYEDARGSVSGEYPDVFEVVSVLTYTEYLPQDPWTFRPDLDAAVVQTLTDGIIAVAGTTQGENALEAIFGYDLTGITTTEDSAYNIVRQLVATFGLHMEPCHSIFLPSVLKRFSPYPLTGDSN